MAKAAEETAAALAKAEAKVERLTLVLAKAQAAVEKLRRKVARAEQAPTPGRAEQAQKPTRAEQAHKPTRAERAQKPTRADPTATGLWEQIDRAGQEPRPGRTKGAAANGHDPAPPGQGKPARVRRDMPPAPGAAEALTGAAEEPDDAEDGPQGREPDSELVTRASHGRLMSALGLGHDALPLGGEWRADIDLMCLLVDHVLRARPQVVVELGAGLSTAVLARALERAGAGQLWTVHHDPNFLDEARELVAGLGLGARVTAIEAALGEYADGLWYEGLTGQLPNPIDFLFIDGPPHHAGRFPRHPAGPELFGRMAPGGVIVLDDGKRQKEIKTLARWASEYPDWRQVPLGTARQAVQLRRG